MIMFNFGGHKISIRNDDWRKLKERFNPENAELSPHGVYRIRIACSLCKRHRIERSCHACPLTIFKGCQPNGCLVLLYELLEPGAKFSSGDESISWLKENDAVARRQLNAILKRMEKVETNQGKLI